MPTEDRAAAKQRFVAFLTRSGLRLTSQRRAIIDVVFGTDQHFTADQLLEWSRQRDDSVSRATVYRTLPLLTASGLVKEIDFGKDYKFYDPNYADHPNHNHIICQDCGRIIEFESETIQLLEQEIGRKHGFVLQGQRLQLLGSCEELRRTGKCPHKETFSAR